MYSGLLYAFKGGLGILQRLMWRYHFGRILGYICYLISPVLTVTTLLNMSFVFVLERTANQNTVSNTYNVLCSHWIIWNTSTEIVGESCMAISPDLISEPNVKETSEYRNINQLYPLLGTTL